MLWFSHPLDRRRFPRFKADVLATANLVLEDKVLSLRTRCDSISEGGVDASGLQSLALGDLVTLWLYLPVSMQPVWVDTIVVRRSSDRCGLEFLSLRDDQRNLIKRYCHLQPKERSRRWI
jgi:hypothetical protein